MPKRRPSAPSPQSPPAVTRAEALAHAIATDILEGRHPVGSLLPTETELAARHKLGVAAVRGAIKQLEALGLAVRSRGGAVRIVSGEIRATYLIAGGGLDGTLGYSGPTRLTLDKQRHVAADAELALLLGVAEGSRWLHLTGLRLPGNADFGPLSWTDIWLTGDIETSSRNAAYSADDIAELTGATIGSVEEDLSAALLTPAQARLLRARGGTAALHLLRRYLRPSGALVAAVRDVHPADRITVTVKGRRTA